MIRRREFLRYGAFAAAATTSLRAAAALRAATGPRVLIVGGGFAGAACALELRRVDPGVDVALIDPDAHYITCPLSNEAIIGLRSLKSLTLGRDGLQRAGIRYIADRAAAIDSDSRKVSLRSGLVLGYDRLVVAPGIRLLWGTPEGYDEDCALRMPHAWQAGSQTALLAEQLHAIPDGGTVALSVPAGLMRCPPGPYERASLIAHWLKLHKPRSKLLIFDSNNHFPRQDVFTTAWQELYPGVIEWIPVTQGGAVTRVDAKNLILYTSLGEHRVAVANVIPPQAPGQIALDAGLATGHGWCPIQPLSFESQLAQNVHVIGDACIAGAMPKSASAAFSQARQCAAAIAALLAGRAPAAPNFDSVCYSAIEPSSALAIRGAFTVSDGDIRQVESPGGTAADSSPSAANAREARDWYKRIRAASFGA
jgi:NADPH-dependent 2,4-dienoyl-CoA reductase/sulfur reductase-like enzyme